MADPLPDGPVRGCWTVSGGSWSEKGPTPSTIAYQPNVLGIILYTALT